MSAKEQEQLLQKIKGLKDQVNSVFVGNEIAVHGLLVGFLSGMHVLIEDIPGVGKTTLAKTLARSAGLDFARIQFTPDLLPGDVIGMTVWSGEKREFIFKPGAIMHQFILADEVNRASARTQSSLLESMQEHAVTVDGRTYPVPEPFFVIATQNPVSFTGTFQLPEAEVDRFGISFSIGYPSADGLLSYSAGVSFSFSPSDIKVDERQTIEESITDKDGQIELERMALKFQLSVLRKSLSAAGTVLAERQAGLAQAMTNRNESAALLKQGHVTSLEDRQSELDLESARAGLFSAMAGVLKAQSDILLLW